MEIKMEWQRHSAPGSADLVLSLSGELITAHATYIGDGLGSVLQAAVDLARGSSSAIAMVPAEPAAVCLFFGGAEMDVYLQVVRFADMQSEDKRWTGGNLVWAGRVNVRGFLKQAALMGKQVLVDYGGVDAYQKEWGGIPFPEENYEALCRITGTS